VQTGVGFVEVFAPQRLSLDRQSLAEAQERPLGRARGLIAQLGIRDLGLVHQPDELPGDAIHVEPLEGEP
jgi:hypothetical protein